jgi:two-component system OmpR family sensor kinase
MSRLRSLRFRVFAAIGLIALVSVGLAFLIGAVLTRRAVERNTLRDVAAQADLIREREEDTVNPFSESTKKSLAPVLARHEAQLFIFELSAAPLYLSAEDVARLRDRRRLDGTVSVDGTRYFYAARRVPNRPDRAFILLRPTEVVASSWRPHLQGLVTGAAAAALLAALASFFLARAIARPGGRVAEASRSLAAERSPEPLPVSGASELASLAQSFNDMAEQLARARAAERSFLLSVSHELKTPLTAIRGYAEGLEEGVLPAQEAAETIRREAGRLERLVRDLLDLARMNRAEFSVRREPIDLGLAAHEVVRRYEPQARSFGVTLEARVEEPARALGDADRTLQVISNLVENALRYTPRGRGCAQRTFPMRSTASTSTRATATSAPSAPGLAWRSSRSSPTGWTARST